MTQYFKYDIQSGMVYKTPEHPDYGKVEKHHFVIPDTPGYHSPVTGQWIEGRKARQRDLAVNKARPWEGMEQEKKEAMRRKKYEDEKLDKKLHKEVEQAFMSLPEQTRRNLGA